MRRSRLFALILLLPLCAGAARAAEDAEDWKLIGGALALLQQLVHVAATSSDSKALENGIDAVLSGENAQANRLALGAMDEFLQEMPYEHRAAFVAIGRDLLTLARRERARIAARGLESRNPPAAH